MCQIYICYYTVVSLFFHTFLSIYIFMMNKYLQQYLASLAIENPNQTLFALGYFSLKFICLYNIVYS